MIIFGLGLSATVAPLTATVLASVEPGHSGVASGVNNAVARIAGLLAIAALGAVVSGAFGSRLDGALAGKHLTRATQNAVTTAKTKPLVTSVTGVSGSQGAEVHAALVDASVYAFRIGMGVGGGLAILGGLVALIGIQNPRRDVRCADCPGGALAPPPPAAA
ncbi:MAG TPA: hypothetical protein VF790_01460, partial [Dissulfurispiraceae bacterium]